MMNEFLHPSSLILQPFLMISLRRNVLIFHQAALGDFVLSWPIAMAAARLWPTNRVLYVTPPSRGQLAERAIGVEWRDGDGWHGLFADAAPEAIRLPEAAMKALAGATLIISFVSNSNDAWARNVRRIAPEAQLICVRARPEENIDRHLTVFHAEQLGDKPDLQGAVSQMLRHVAAAGAVPRRSSGAGVVIHPGSGGEAKRWPADRFAAAGRTLADAGNPVTFVIGEVERESMTKGEIDVFREIGSLASPGTLVELFETLQRASLYVGNDSGPTHLAGLLGVPTLALFGRENDTTWRPLGPGVRLIKRVPLETIAVDEVVAAASEMMTAATPVDIAAVDEE
jgi:heptosyltransferase III